MLLLSFILIFENFDQDFFGYFAQKYKKLEWLQINYRIFDF